MASNEAADAPMTPREKRLSELGMDTLVGEYIATCNDITEGCDGATVTRRFYRRYEIVQADIAEAEPLIRSENTACSKGCSYCCHNRVTAPPNEVLTLVDRILRMPEGERAAVMERVSRNADRVDSMDGDVALSTPMPCALLGPDGACTVYDDRPSNCRRYHSLKLKDCEQSFYNPTDLKARIRLSTPLMVVSSAKGMAFRKVMREGGFDMAFYELHTALREALSDPEGTGGRFCKGERAFLRARCLEEEDALGLGGERPDKAQVD